MLHLLKKFQDEQDLDVKSTIKNGLGSKYFETEPLVWHYTTDRRKTQFVVSFFKKNGILEPVTLWFDGIGGYCEFVFTQICNNLIVARHYF